MSTRLALTVVGTVVGAYFGYPQLGAVAGAMIGSAVDPTTIQGPKINESHQQTAAEGVPRPVIFGTYPCTGNIIQRGPLRIIQTSTSQGKGSTKVKGEKGLRTFAIGICEGVGTVLTVKENNKVVYDVRTGSAMIAESQRWASNKIFYSGSETQLPDPNLVLLDADAPAHRGTMYMVAVDEDVTQMGGAISQYEFEVARAVTQAPGGVTTGPIADRGSYLDVDANGNPFILNHQSGPSTYEIPAGSTYSVETYDPTFQTIIETQSINNPGASHETALRVIAVNKQGQAVTFFGGDGWFTLLSNGAGVADYTPTAPVVSTWHYAEESYAPTPQFGGTVWFYGAWVYVGTQKTSYGNWNRIDRFPLLASGTTIPVSSIIGVDSNATSPAFWMHMSRSGKMHTIASDGVAKTYDYDLTPLSTDTLPASIAARFPNAQAIRGFGIDEDKDYAIYVYVSIGVNYAEVYRRSTAELLATYALSGAPTTIYTTRVVFSGSYAYIQRHNYFYAISLPNTYTGQRVQLSSIVTWLHRRCGVSAAKYDTSELTDTLLGFGMASAGYTAADGIDSLRLGYNFDKSAREKLYYPKRGKAAVKTLTTNDLTALPESTKRAQTAEIPYKLNVRYRDATAGYAVLSQSTGSDSPDRRTTGEVTLDLALSLTADEAAQMADKSYKVTLAEVDGKVELSLMLDVATDLAEADCVGYITADGRTMRVRIEQMDFADWSVKITGTADRQSAYTSAVTGLPSPTPTPPPSTLVGPTQMAIIDGPARTDSEDNISYLAAVTGAFPTWYGSELERSLDGGANYQDVTEFDAAARMGVLLADIPDASPYYTDRTNVVKIQFYRSTAAIDSLTDAQFLTAGVGVFGLEKADGSWEYMQGRDVAVQLDGSVWLSTLHRGVAHSGTSAHTAGARFVWLADAAYIPASSSWLNAALTHRAVSYDQTEDETANAQTRTYVGRAQLERPVASFALTRSGNNVTGKWAPRHRFGSDDAPVASSNFQGFRVTIVGTGTISFDTTAQTFTQDVSSIGGAVTVSVSALNRITGAGPATSGAI